MKYLTDQVQLLLYIGYDTYVTGAALHLLARIEPSGDPIATLSVVETTNAPELHSRFDLHFEEGTRVARYTQSEKALRKYVSKLLEKAMSHSKVALLFPGQGAFYRGVLRESRETYSQIDEVIAEIDAAGRRWMDTPIAELLFGEKAVDVAAMLGSAPEASQVAIYAVSVAVYRILRVRGLQPDVLVGHSFGEIAALVCGGAYSVAEGVEIILHRTAALKALGNAGYMAALGTDRARAEKILELAGGGNTAIASENHKGQTVISGATTDMDRCTEVAKLLSIPFAKLNSPYAFHSPMVKAASDDFATGIRHIEARPLQTPVFSPILDRYYGAGDVLPDCLAKHLVLPVNFAPAVQRLYEEGVGTFVECGALNALSKITSLALGEADVKVVACLDPGVGELQSLKAAVGVLAGRGLLEEPRTETPWAMLLPNATPERLTAFWSARGDEIRAFVQARFAELENAAARVDRSANGTATGELNRPAPSSGETNSPETLAKPAAPSFTRAELFEKLAAIYAEALEYPVEVFAEDVQLEAELGIDSVKQTELLARLSERYNLPPRSADFRLSDYSTMGKIVDFVFATLQQATPVNGAAAAARTPENSQASAGVSRSKLFAELAAMYAEALEYPPEVFTEDVQLEAELGIDSVKQTELLARVGERYNLPPRSADFRLSDYSTMGKVVDLVFAAGQRSATGTEDSDRPKMNGAPYALAMASGGGYETSAYVN